jgi:hypothetical protein
LFHKARQIPHGGEAGAFVVDHDLTEDLGMGGCPMRKHVEERRLSRTRRSHEGNNLPGFDEAACRGQDGDGLLAFAVFDANRHIVP